MQHLLRDCSAVGFGLGRFDLRHVIAHCRQDSWLRAEKDLASGFRLQSLDSGLRKSDSTLFFHSLRLRRGQGRLQQPLSQLLCPNMQ